MRKFVVIVNEAGELQSFQTENMGGPFIDERVDKLRSRIEELERQIAAQEDVQKWTEDRKNLLESRTVELRRRVLDLESRLQQKDEQMEILAEDELLADLSEMYDEVTIRGRIIADKNEQIGLLEGTLARERMTIGEIKNLVNGYVQEHNW